MVDRLYCDPRLAVLYDRLYPLAAHECNFYLPMIMAASSVLDVGCGTGALLHAARRAGHCGRLCGLDPAPAMLALHQRLKSALDPAGVLNPGRMYGAL